MYKTDHFQLNQWEKPDRVLMEDFNADNARLDAALQTLTERPTITKLNTFTVDRPITGAAVFDMDVSGIDWGAWQYIFADFQLQGSGYMLLYPNRDHEAATSRGYVTSNSSKSLGGMLSCDFHSTALTRVEFQIFGCGAHTLQTVCPYQCITASADGISYDALETLHLRPSHESYTMNAGSKITVLGMR